MGRATTHIPMSHRVLSPNPNYATGDHQHDQPMVQLSGSIFGFLEEQAIVLSSPENDIYEDVQQEIEDVEECEPPEDIETKIKFWDTQRQNLHVS